MGAEVIKIESQVYIDICRSSPAGFADGKPGLNRNGYFHHLNYGKKAINLNLGKPKGRELAYEIVKRSDLVLECFPTATAARLGLTYDDTRKVKPDAVTLSVSLLGKTGTEPSQVSGWGRMGAGATGSVDAGR